jgi:hypothetical protein
MTSLPQHELTTLPASRQPAFTCATVCSGPVDASYRRAGRGHTVVALTAADWHGGPTLFAALADDFRLIVPTLERPSAARADSPAFAHWLTAFLDGLGLEAVTLVADERFGAAALGCALLDPARIDGVAIVLDGILPEASGAAPADTLCVTGTGVLVSWLGPDHDASARELARALRHRRAPAE